jgi:hypothetical protein
MGVGEKNIKDLLKRDSQAIDLPINHLIISNSVAVDLTKSYGKVMHVDPIYSRECKQGIPQTEKEISYVPKFGSGGVKYYELDAVLCNTLFEAEQIIKEREEIITYFKKIESASDSDLQKIEKYAKQLGFEDYSNDEDSDSESEEESSFRGHIHEYAVSELKKYEDPGSAAKKIDIIEKLNLMMGELEALKASSTKQQYQQYKDQMSSIRQQHIAPQQVESTVEETVDAQVAFKVN